MDECVMVTQGGNIVLEDIVIPGIPFKARCQDSGDWGWFVQDGDCVRSADAGDLADVVQELNDLFMLTGTPDEFVVDGLRVFTQFGFDTRYNNIPEALDYLREGLTEEDYYEMLECIERRD